MVPYASNRAGYKHFCQLITEMLFLFLPQNILFQFIPSPDLSQFDDQKADNRQTQTNKTTCLSQGSFDKYRLPLLVDIHILDILDISTALEAKLILRDNFPQFCVHIKTSPFVALRFAPGPPGMT